MKKSVVRAISIPKQLDEKIEEERLKYGLSRSEIIRRYLKRILIEKED